MSRLNSIKIKCDGLLYDDYFVEGNYDKIMFGPELEFFVVDKTTLKLKDYQKHFAELPEYGVSIKPELPTEQIEILSFPSDSIMELEDRLGSTLEKVVKVLDGLNAQLLPISLLDTEEFTITSHPRYRLLLDTLGFDFESNAVKVISDQINIGAENEQQAFFLFNHLRNYLPLFMGLSVSSPFREGKPNGIASNRMDFYDASIKKYQDLTGIPPEINSLQEYARELEVLPVFQHPNMFYKYMRPMPQRGVAAEIRCIDKQHTLKDYLALVTLSKAIVNAAIKGDNLIDESFDINTEFNQARKFGVGQKEEFLLERLSRYIGSNEKQYLTPLFDRINCNLSEGLIQTYQKQGLKATYSILAQRFRDSLG